MKNSCVKNSRRSEKNRPPLDVKKVAVIQGKLSSFSIINFVFRFAEMVERYCVSRKIEVPKGCLINHKISECNSAERKEKTVKEKTVKKKKVSSEVAQSA